MRILLSNDDGIHATGIQTLVQCLQDLADVWVVAPDRERSGASSALTFKQPLRYRMIAERTYVTDGTPGDCVNLAIQQILPERPDLLITGINHGANLADDVIYSGTVGAAIEGHVLGIPAMAISLVDAEGEGHFDTAGWVANRLVQQFQRQGLTHHGLINVNVPNVPRDTLAGFAVTQTGRRSSAERIISREDPVQRPIFWFGAAAQPKDAGEGTDLHAIAQQQVSVTPLTVDYTHHEAIPTYNQWVEHLK